MADGAIRITGDRELAAAFSDLRAVVSGRGLSAALSRGGKPIVDDARRRVPVLSGDLRDSIGLVFLLAAGTVAEAAIEADTPYARRIELGFVGTDSLGRTYHQAAQPYLRPAMEAQSGAAIDAIADEVRAAIGRAVR